MARSALNRRRGTKRGSRRGSTAAILGGLFLLIVGVVGGVIVGFMAFGGTSSTDDSRSSLRKTSAAVDPNKLVEVKLNNAEVEKVEGS